MKDRISKAGEQHADRLSRRQLAGRLARVALPLAAAIGGLLAGRGADARLGRGVKCCFTGDFSSVCYVRPKQPCPPSHPEVGSCPLGVSVPFCGDP